MSLRNHYTVTYTPTNAKLDGSYREITVKLKMRRKISLARLPPGIPVESRATTLQRPNRFPATALTAAAVIETAATVGTCYTHAFKCMDFHHKEILKRYARMATGRPFAPILLNILITSVCDMRCVHCFFTDELDDKPRKKLQMTTSKSRHQRNARCEPRRADHRRRRTVHAEGPSGNRAGFLREQQARIDLPDVEWPDSATDHSRRHAHSEECPNLNVTVALGIDGLKEDHESIRQKTGSWDIVIDTARKLQADQERGPPARYSDLHLLHEQQSGSDLRVVRFPEIRAETGQGQFQLHPAALRTSQGTDHRQDRDTTSFRISSVRTPVMPPSRTATRAMPVSSKPRSMSTCTN